VVGIVLTIWGQHMKRKIKHGNERNLLVDESANLVTSIATWFAEHNRVSLGVKTMAGVANSNRQDLFPGRVNNSLVSPIRRKKRPKKASSPD
jgi:hypothetical protein